MNPEGCDRFHRTDEILVFNQSVGTCDASIIGFSVWTAILISFRIIITFDTWRSWLRLNKVRTRNKTRTKRIPFQPLVMTGSSLVQVLFLVLAGVDVISTVNGTSVFIFGLWTWFWYAQAGLTLKKVVGLGIRLAFLGKKSDDSSTRWSKHESEEKNQARHVSHIPLGEDLTSKFDIVLKFVVVLMICCVIESFLFYFIFGLFVSPGESYTIQAGLVSNCSFIFLTVFSVTWQLQRCINAVKSSSFFEVNRDTKISLALNRMRFQQVTLVVLGLPEAFFYLLHILNILPINWIWVLYHGSSDIVVLLCFGLLTRLLERCRLRSHTQSSSDGKKIVATHNKDNIGLATFSSHIAPQNTAIESRTHVESAKIESKERNE